MNWEMFPNSIMPPITQSVGYFGKTTPPLAHWLCAELMENGAMWAQRSVATSDPESRLECLLPLADVGVTRILLVSIAEDWTAVLNNGQLGTDLAMIPSIATRRLRCRTIRATLIPDGQSRFGASILEVFEPGAEPPLRCRRTISATNDGGRWRFDQFGEPFDFEDQTAYGRRRVRDRFTTEQLYRYLDHLRVPAFTLRSLAEGPATLLEERRHP